jgi:hypothetical protein
MTPTPKSESSAMSRERLEEIEQIARNAGSTNLWTGTTGRLAAIIMELLEVVRNAQRN